jgi:methyl-accepting chemotaxis protein
MKISFKLKILLSMFVVGVVCTAIVKVVSVQTVSQGLEDKLVEKSRAILSRVDQSASYVAEMNTLASVIQETVKKFPDGNLSEDQKLNVMKSVPIYAAFQIGGAEANKDSYQFRVASDFPRSKKYKATEEEMKFLEKFRNDPKLQEIVTKNETEKTISVTVPVRISKSRNCLSCHGSPDLSPWKNGKDILGHPMENMKDGDLRGLFSIVSSTEPVEAAVLASTKQIVLYGSVSCFILILIGFILIRKPMELLTSLSDEVASSNSLLNQTASKLAASSQQLAASSQESASSVEETSSSLTEISAMVESSLQGANQTVELSNKVSKLVSQGSASMNSLQGSMQEISGLTNNIEKLSKLIEDIGDKTKLIDDIVFQTRLLSFNASVEAERAGESGRGFAVVAQEVGNLASMSGKRAQEISQIVKNSIKEAHEMVELSKLKIELGVKNCSETSTRLNDIELAAKEILGCSEKVLKSSVEQNSGIQQINQSIQQISQASHENSSAAGECSNASDNLIIQGEKLNTVVLRMKDLLFGTKESEDSLQFDESKQLKSNYVKPKAKLIHLSDKKKSKIFKTNLTEDELYKKAVNDIADQGEDPWSKL